MFDAPGKQQEKLSQAGSALLGLPEGISVAAAEGDQPTAMAGSLIGEAGMVFRQLWHVSPAQTPSAIEPLRV